MVAQSPVREIVTQAVAAPYEPVPRFRNGYLVTFRGRGPFNAFSAFAPDGSHAYDKVVEIPGNGASTPSIADVDFDTSGKAAVAVSATGGTSCMTHGLLVLDSAGGMVRFIDTGCFVATHVAIAADHTIWTMGFERDAYSTDETRQDYSIVRQFSFEGKQLNGFLPRSTFPLKTAPGAGGGDTLILTTPDRVGLIARSGPSGAREWIELDLKGATVQRISLEGTRHPFAAFTADDHLYLQGNGTASLQTVDAATQSLKSVPGQSATLMGSDGNRLVFRDSRLGAIQLQWFEQPVASGTASVEAH
jgi:hypothetical protein